MLELVCPAGNLPALKAAVDSGADAVYIGFKDDTNARQFAGLNFTAQTIAQGIKYVRDHDRKIFVAINTYAQPEGFDRWKQSIDLAANLGVDAVIVADIGVLEYATEKYPDLPRHLSVQSSSTNYMALNFFQRHFDIKRAVLPRVLSIRQVRQLAKKSTIPLEVFGFGSLCVMAEGRCFLSSYVTGESPNTCGICSPAKAVRWEETVHGLESRLGGLLIDRYAPGENAGYPTLCKGRFLVEGNTYYALEEPTSLNTLDLLPKLADIGIRAIKIEGRQRSPAYVQQVVRVWREAIDTYHRNPVLYTAQESWQETLAHVSEGTQTTLGAYHRPWM